MAALSDIAPTTVAVAPTTTTVLDVPVSQTKTLVVQVENLDVTQTFSGQVLTRLDSSVAYAPSPAADFAEVWPGASAVAFLDVSGADGLRLVGTMSGAGGNVRVTARRR